MRRLSLFLAAAAFLAWGLSCASTPRCPASGPPEQELRGVESRWLDALFHKDVRALDELLADDFQDNAYNGNVYLKIEILDHLARGGPRFPSLGLSETRVRVYGETGVFTGVNTVKTEGGPVRVRFTDVFRREGCRWRAVSAQETVIQPLPSGEPGR